MDAGIVLSAASFIISSCSFLFFRAYLQRRTGGARILADFQEEVNKITSEIDSAADRDSLLVEERVKSLRILLEETDKRIAELNRRIGVLGREEHRQKAQEQAYAELGKTSVPIRHPPVGRPKSPPRENVSLPQNTETGLAVANRDESATLPAAKPEAKPAALPAAMPFGDTQPLSAERDSVSGFSPDNRPQPERSETPVSQPAAAAMPRIIRSREQIVPKPPVLGEKVAELYRAGFSADLIASRLGASITEVELAITLAEQLRQ